MRGGMTIFKHAAKNVKTVKIPFFEGQVILSGAKLKLFCQGHYQKCRWFIRGIVCFQTTFYYPPFTLQLSCMTIQI